jgi:hypothetical protein
MWKCVNECESFRCFPQIMHSLMVTRVSSDTAHLRAHRCPRFLSATLLRGAEVGLFGLVFAFFSIRSFHAFRSAPVSTSSLAAARRICVCPIFPQPPEIGKKISGASSTNAACCSSVSIRFS